MKHNIKITLILLGMFIITQFIGLYVVNYYSPTKITDGVIMNKSAPALPYGLETPKIESNNDFYTLFPSIIIAFIISISLLFFLSKFDMKFILKAWFFLVVVIALGVSFNSIFPQLKYTPFFVLAAAIPLAFVKIYKRNFLIHNFTELFIYPGIAAIFVTFLNVWTIIILLILISVYDMWAVWHSGIMQKMAKYQINKLNIFSGFFVPYLSKKVKMQISKIKNSKLKNKKIKVNIAILGGGDVVFPIIAAGVMMKVFGLVPAICVVAGATLGLIYLLLFSEKKKFYPAMPFITAGIFTGMIFGYLLR
ncbi:MAG: presenilin family intramembrane aspartyl protease [Nanoarchaeota archaeon]